MYLYLFGMFADAGALQPLHSSNAESSSFLKSSWNKYTENYHPNYVLDNNPKTAWVEGVEGNGENEKILIPISSVDKVRTIQLRIRNGYQKSAGLLRANSAPKDVTITLSTRNGAIVEKKKFTLKKTMGWQTVDIPVTNRNTSIGIVQLTINSVHPGTKYKDTCISDIEVHVDSDSPYKSQVESHKQQLLSKWVKQRLDDAKYFANKPKEYPFAATAFQRTQRKAAKLNFQDLHKETIALADGEKWGALFYTRENKSPLQVLPDGLHDMPKDIWRLSDLALFETKKEFAKVIDDPGSIEEPYYSPPRSEKLGNFTRATREDGTVTRLSFTQDFEECERMCYSIKKKYTIFYDGDHVSKIMIDKVMEEEGMFGSSTDLIIYAFQRKNDKINSFTEYIQHSYNEFDERAYNRDGKEVFIPKTSYMTFRYTSANEE